MTSLDGGCHCGAVRIRIRVPDGDWRALECNCSICAAKGFLNRIVKRADFELVSGEEALSTYRFNTGVAQHRFCRHCGIHVFTRPRSHPEDYDVNLRCLDGDARTRFAIEPFDGRHWEESVASIRDGEETA